MARISLKTIVFASDAGTWSLLEIPLEDVYKVGKNEDKLDLTSRS